VVGEKRQIPLGEAFLMKATSTAVTNLINAKRAAGDAPIAFAECFQFTTTVGTVYTWTNVDFPVIYGGHTFNCTGPLVSGLKYKASVGLEVDKQQLTIAARPTDTINGAPFLIALRDGAFDGASVQRDRVFLTALGGAVVGGVTLFKGRVSTVDQVGRTTATLTVASDLVVLDYDMPRNLFSPTCVHTLYDSGCGVIRGAFASNGAAGAGSTANAIAFSGAEALHAQGSIVFSFGANANVRATVKSVAVGSSLNLIYPLPFAPSVGDAFTVYAGCDHTQNTCNARFSNLVNFRGFPYVPPPQMAY
jgi:uncharacterized phage protein (TIGR02218 family)